MFFRYSNEKMSHAKIVVCIHSAQKFYDTNKEILINLNSTFKCTCNETYGSHRLFFCLCVECFKGIKRNCDLNSVNNKWMKFCILRSSLDILNFNGNMRFFSFKDIIGNVSFFLFWCYRESRIKKKWFMLSL